MVKIDQLVQELEAKIAGLEARLAKLEQPQRTAAAVPVAQASSAPTEGISDELMLVIAAAVAAYLGERAHIRVVRLVSSHNWAQQGRVSIQASHRLQ